MSDAKVKIYLFYCANSMDSNELNHKLMQNGDEFKIIPLPCSGKTGVLYLTRTFESGAEVNRAVG